MRQGDLPAAKMMEETCAQWVTVMIGNADRFADSTGGGARTETTEAK